MCNPFLVTFILSKSVIEARVWRDKERRLVENTQAPRDNGSKSRRCISFSSRLGFAFSTEK